MLWLALCLVLLVSIAVLALPLLRPSTVAVVGDETRMRANVDIYRQRLVELDEELASGKIQADSHAQLVAELKRNLLDSAQTQGRKAGAGYNQLWVVGVLALVVPAASIMLYFHLSPRAELNEWQVLRDTLVPEIEKVIADPSAIQQLDEKVDTRDFLRAMQHYLHVEGGSSEGWALFANLMGRFEAMPQATTAARKAYKYDPDNRLHALRFAQFELASNNGKMTPRAERVLREWAVKAPEDPGVLMLLGMGFFASERWADAVDAWEPLVRVLDKIPSDDPQHNQAVQSVKRNLSVAKARLSALAQNAHARAGLGPIAAAHAEMGVNVKPDADISADVTNTGPEGSAKVTVEVSGDPALLEKAPASAQLYIFAKAAAGPPMPLAVKKVRPTQWPVKVTLTAADAMMPAASLSEHKSVLVTARWSESGQIAMGSEGSIVSESEAVNPFEQPTVRLTLSDASSKSDETAKAALPEEPAEAITEQTLTRQITVSVSGAQSLLDQAPASARLFVVAKAVGGPPMPLAVKKVRPDAWPVTLTLTEGDAMMPASSLAQHDAVVVSALWSESGQIPMGSSSGVQRVESGTVNPLEQPRVSLSLP
jgi:cytochrome c-type biogenesis protein CcmH